jgi:uncharacterized protein involved in type VI secretion and phage assembly
MSRTLLDLLTPPGETAAGRIFGVVTAVVTSNDDPDKLGRIKVRLPWAGDDDESPWARLAAPMGGKERGWYSLPEVEDEVLVAFEHGDPRFPYVLGALWSSESAPPLANEGGTNDVRVLRSRSGHVIRLDDKDGEEKIEIADGSEKNRIVISTKDNSVTIESAGDVTVAATDGKLVLTGKGGVEIVSEGGLKVTSKQDAEIKSDGQVTVKGSAINLN